MTKPPVPGGSHGEFTIAADHNLADLSAPDASRSVSSFSYLLTGVLIGEAQAGTARASVFAPADYWPQRLSDLCCRHQLSGQALMAPLAGVALTSRYPHGLPERLCWIADASYTEKPYAHHLASVDWFHRLKHVAGRAKNLKGHC